MLSPKNKLKCLLVQPKFSVSNFWNFKESIETTGAKTNSPPLGLLTVAALLPQNWEFRLLDLNVRDFDEAMWQWSDLVCVGGMLPQQEGILAIIERAKADGKYVAVGGADPTSQPDIYKHADALVMGEGEVTIPLWLAAWEQGRPNGVFKSDVKPDVTKVPIPRFDIVNFDEYLQLTLQYSRGCPFNCEFCDIIELYGRVPRVKTPEQFVAEMEYLYQLGYRGWLDIVDDNFIGNKRNVKKMLPVLLEWCQKRRFPFFYSTEASMNLADDLKLLEMMRAVDFRFVFLGIETPDPELLMMTQKSQNTMKPIVERIQTIYQHGMLVFGGFIIGFDNEKKGMDVAMIRCVEDSGVIMPMIGLLVALPNTQLTRRLLREGRLLDADGELVTDASVPYRVQLSGKSPRGRDNTSAGLNFIPTRPRADILQEFANTVKTVYDPRVYMDRLLRTTRALRFKRKHIPGLWELKRSLRGFWNLSVKMTRNPRTRWLYWRNVFSLMTLGIDRFEMGMTMVGSYLHLEKQTIFLLEEIGRLEAIERSRAREAKSA